MVFVLDMKGNILAVNDAVQKRLLYKEKELVGTNVLLLHIPERREEALQIVQGMIAGTISSCPVPIQAKDGTRIEVETKVARGRWNGQDVLFGVSRDISERRRTERALQESEDKYRLLVQNANVAIVVLQDGLVKLVNPTAIAKMGFTESVLKARPFLSFVHPDDRATVMERHQMRLEGIPSPDEYEVRLLTQRGDTLWAEVHAIAIVWEGRPAALNFINDITERKQLERALREASRKLALLSSVTRHDITNQLQVLKGRLALLEMENPGSSKFDHLQRAEAAAAQISTMIDFTKEYEDIGITAPVWMSPGGHMASVFAALHPIGVTLENNMGGLEVLADPLAEKVPYNLVDNSMRHGENVTRIKLSARQVGDALLIVYEDDGVGISDEDRKRIFEKGFGKNSGLGLFLTREILAITGITFTENGKAGEGVRFEMLVPAGAWRYGK
jgi:PAS domain S-box-containing protein